MAEYDLLVLNGLVVTAEETREFDIAIKDGVIAKVVPRGSLATVTAKKTIDAEGGMVMVGIRIYFYENPLLTQQSLVELTLTCMSLRVLIFQDTF